MEPEDVMAQAREAARALVVIGGIFFALGFAAGWYWRTP